MSPEKASKAHSLVTTDWPFSLMAETIDPGEVFCVLWDLICPRALETEKSILVQKSSALTPLSDLLPEAQCTASAGALWSTPGGRAEGYKAEVAKALL